MPALARLGLDPAGELAGLRRLEPADLAAGRLDSVDEPLLPGFAGAAGRRLDEDDAAARRDERQEREEPGAVLVADGERAGVRHDRQRAAAEHRLRRDELLELADLDAGLVAVAADLDPFDDAAMLRPEGRRHSGDGAARREVVVAPEIGDRRGRASGVGRAGGHPPDGIAHPDATDGPAAACWTGSGLTAAIDVPGAAAAA